MQLIFSGSRIKPGVLLCSGQWTRPQIANEDTGRPAVFQVKCGKVRFFVIGRHSNCPVVEDVPVVLWEIGIQAAGGCDFPRWPMRFERARDPRDLKLLIEAPQNVRVTEWRG